MIYAVKVRQLHLVELCFLRGSYIQKATTTNFGTRQNLAALACGNSIFPYYMLFLCWYKGAGR